MLLYSCRYEEPGSVSKKFSECKDITNIHSAQILNGNSLCYHHISALLYSFKRLNTGLITHSFPPFELLFYRNSLLPTLAHSLQTSLSIKLPQPRPSVVSLLSYMQSYYVYYHTSNNKRVPIYVLNKAFSKLCRAMLFRDFTSSINKRIHSFAFLT